jgi:pilus assembly protein Flp/PilA
MIAYLIALLRGANILPKDEKGQDAAEYALLIALIAIVIIGAVTLLGVNINAIFTNIAGAI